MASAHSSLIWTERDLTREKCAGLEIQENPIFVFPLSLLTQPKPSVSSQETLLFYLDFARSSTNETLWA